MSNANDGYDNIQCFSPIAALDAKVEVDVTYPIDGQTAADPSITLRATDATVTTYDTFDGYNFYVFRNFAGIDREEPGDNGTELTSQTISPPLSANTTYHFTFSVVGTNPVKLSASVKDGSGNTVVTLAFDDNDAAKRFTTKGRVSIGGGSKTTNTKWDNFVQTTYDAP